MTVPQFPGAAFTSRPAGSLPEKATLYQELNHASSVPPARRGPRARLQNGAPPPSRACGAHRRAACRPASPSGPRGPRFPARLTAQARRVALRMRGSGTAPQAGSGCLPGRRARSVSGSGPSRHLTDGVQTPRRRHGYEDTSAPSAGSTLVDRYSFVRSGPSGRATLDRQRISASSGDIVTPRPASVGLRTPHPIVEFTSEILRSCNLSPSSRTITIAGKIGNERSRACSWDDFPGHRTG